MFFAIICSPVIIKSKYFTVSWWKTNGQLADANRAMHVDCSDCYSV